MNVASASGGKTRTIVGLEIHVQLKTKSKMFCGCAVEFEAPPNSRVCPVCLGYPGALPVINEKALHHSLLVGMALNCRIARRTQWDRKSYFYPDMPKNYQISQYELPLAEEGFFEFSCDGSTKRVRIRRAHLEEDAGKNLHQKPDQNPLPDGRGSVGPCTLVDLNRAGTPLLEIVTEPDIETGREAYTFALELQRLVTYLGVSEGNMKKGQMRFEPNVNVVIEHDGEEYRTPIAEIKNLNSFKALRNAIDYESRRQASQWSVDHDYQLGKRPNENRGWNDDKGQTEFQREKEAVHDYRYFPDPDLTPVVLSDDILDSVRAKLGELPIARRRRFAREYGLSEKDAETIVGDRATADLLEEAIQSGGPPDIAAKQFVNVWLKLANEGNPFPHGRGSVLGSSVPGLGVDAGRMGALARITGEGLVSATAANRIAAAMLTRKDTPEGIAHDLGLVQVQDVGASEAWVEEAFAANQKAVNDAMKSPQKMKAAAGFLRGQVMRLSGGKADPKLIGELIQERLAALRPTRGSGD